jgi:hypothetical protein
MNDEEFISLLPEQPISNEAFSLIEKVQERKAKEETGFARELVGGLSFQTADEIEAFFRSAENGTDYEFEKMLIDQEREEYRELNPGTALAAEIVGSIPTGIGLSRTLAARGITNLGAQGAIETGAYSFAAGNTPEERVTGAAVGAAFGGAIGAGLQKLVGQPTTAKTTPDTYEVGEIVDYQLADGTTRMAKVIGDEDGSLKLTTDLLSAQPSPRKTFSVSKEDPPIFKRFDDDLDSGRTTRIERVPEGEEIPFTPLTERPSAPNVNGPFQQIRIATEEVAGPMPQVQAPRIIYSKEAFPDDEGIFIENIADKMFRGNDGDVNIVTQSQIGTIASKVNDIEDLADPEVKAFISANSSSQDEKMFLVDAILGNKEQKEFGKAFNNLIYIDDTLINQAGYSSYLKLNVVAHEIGHVAARGEFGKQLNKHLANWDVSTANVTPRPRTELGKKIIDEWKASGSAENIPLVAQNQRFEEWIADSVARYALAEAPKAPSGAVQRYFWELSKSIKKLFRDAVKASDNFIPGRIRTAANEQSELRGFIKEFVARSRPEAPRPTVKSVVPGDVVAPSTRSYAYREAAPDQWTESVYGMPKNLSWRDATTAGELWDGIKASFTRTYDRLTPMTDLLQRRVGREPGARAQRADETATKLNQLDFEKYVVPIESIAKQWDDNPEFRRMSLYYSEGSISRPDFIQYIKSEFGEKAANDMSEHLKWSTRENEKYNIGIYGQEKKQEYLHRQRIVADNEDANKLIEQEISSRLDEFEISLPTDVGNKSRKVNVKWEYDHGKKDIINNYQNIFLTNTRRIMNNRKIFQYAEKFGVKGADNSNTPEEVLMKIRREIVKRGISPDRADFAIQEIRRNLLGERKMMNSVLQALQTLGYGGSLAGPKSALLNIHDIPQTAVNQGPRAVRSWFQGIVRDKNGRMLSDSFGFSQQSKFGEFANSMNQTLAQKGGMARSLNNTANVTTDTLMKASLFQLSDKIGKGGVLRSVQQRAVDDVQRGGWQELKKKWGTYFSDNELKRMAADLQRHGMDDSKYSQKGLELVEEMMMAGLGQQQLISAGGRPAFWADHPNARVFLALRGFAMKQQAVALRNTLQNAKEGNIQEAKDWAIRYALYSMGGFAVINEGRQILFGDGDPSSDRMIRSFFDQLVGVASLNSASISDYSWGKIQRGEFLDYVLANNIPIAVGVPAEAVEDMFDVLTGEKTPSQLPETLPLFKQTQNLQRNIEELNEPGMLTSSN